MLGWQRGEDTWAVIRSHSPGEAKQRLLDLAAQVVSNVPGLVRAPFSMSYAPQGFVATHVSRNRLDRAGTFVFGLSKGQVSQEAPLTIDLQHRDDPEDSQTMGRLGEPDSRQYARQLWHIKTATPGAAEIVLRRENGCYAHIRIADVTVIAPQEQEKIVNGIILGLCLDTREWAHPFAALKNL